MTTNELYQSAIKNMQETGERYGVSRHTLENGDLIICSVKGVAGRSIVAKHSRMTFHLKLSTEQYSKQISRETAVTLLR